jgi:hypothetical protein
LRVISHTPPGPSTGFAAVQYDVAMMAADALRADVISNIICRKILRIDWRG